MRQEQLGIILMVIGSIISISGVVIKLVHIESDLSWMFWIVGFILILLGKTVAEETSTFISITRK